MRDKRRSTRSKCNRDIALQDWSLMYKNNEQMEFFINLLKFSKCMKFSCTFEKNRSENKKGAQKMAIKRTA